ncbi:hypothetical protein V8E55_002480 [Tylopilus felleus]
MADGDERSAAPLCFLFLLLVTSVFVNVGAHVTLHALYIARRVLPVTFPCNPWSPTPCFRLREKKGRRRPARSHRLHSTPEERGFLHWPLQAALPDDRLGRARLSDVVSESGILP